MPSFIPDRSLLNPQFEGYKLSFDPTPEVVQIPLPQYVNQSRPGVGSLDFLHVASRVRHNHLAIGNGTAMYVANDGSVFLIEIDEKNATVLRPVFQIPQNIGSDARPNGEYPAAVHLSENLWFLSDGFGSSYIVRVLNGSSPARLVAQWDLIIDGNLTPTPFQIHCAALIAPHNAVAVLSSLAPRSQNVSTQNAKEQYTFDVWGVNIPLSDSIQDSNGAFEVLWRKRGTHIPLFVTYVQDRSAFILMGGSDYTDVSQQTTQGHEPSADELAPIPRLGENLDEAPPPFSWMQANDSVTIVFALPGLTDKRNIRTTFERDKLSLNIGSPPLPEPSYSNAPLWDLIDPSSSLWTWERGTATKSGLLTLHLEKANQNTRWSSVFRHGFEKTDVPETLDPLELTNIREALDKFTAALDDGSGLGHGVPSLAEGERDVEIDSTVGYAVKLTWIGGDAPADDAVSSVLSLPLPGIQVTQTLSLVIKNDIDGLLFNLEAPAQWRHSSTYPALGFVLASKRDTRFTYHYKDKAVLAFESGGRTDGGGNIYIYRGCNRAEKWAKQGVFRQNPGTGALIGVGAIVDKEGQSVLLCLSERELSVCRNIF